MKTLIDVPGQESLGILPGRVSCVLKLLPGQFALVKRASDRQIIDSAGTSHVQKKANVFR